MLLLNNIVNINIHSSFDRLFQAHSAPIVYFLPLNSIKISAA